MVTQKTKETTPETVRLYDISQCNYPNQRGDSFRSLQVFECIVCTAMTNCVVMGGWPGYGMRIICPNSGECWHHEIELKIKWLKKPHPAVYMQDLEMEIETMRGAAAEYVRHDLAGNPDMNQRELFFGPSRMPTGCRHF